jgi:rhodanese-related sulfurtransferase
MSTPAAPNTIATLSVVELGQYLNSAQSDALHPQLIDVREPEEVSLAALPGFVNLPLSQAEQWTASIHQQFDPHTDTWVLCHHGMRSQQMCHWLVQQGFTSVKNITGGIDAYSQCVDATIPRY